MNFKNLILTAVILCAGILGSCTDDKNTTDPTTTDVIIPLKVGNTWVYRVTSMDTTAGVVATSTGSTSTIVKRDSTINGSQWFGMSSFFGGSALGYFQNRSDGAWFNEKNKTAMFFKFPAAVNDTYSAPVGTFKVMSTNQSITVPKGTYSCYHYRSSQAVVNDVTIFDFFVAPNLGIVKYDLYNSNTSPIDNIVRSSLKKFELESTIIQ